jgi:hypothetical protein
MPPGTLTPGALRDAVKVERDTSGAPSLIVVEGLDAAELTREDLQDLRGLARELEAEVWLESSCTDERHVSVPEGLEAQSDLVAVILALEPGDGAVGLRALKDHDSPDVSTLRVSLDPRTLLLVRS